MEEGVVAGAGAPALRARASGWDDLLVVREMWLLVDRSVEIVVANLSTWRLEYAGQPMRLKMMHVTTFPCFGLYAYAMIAVHGLSPVWFFLLC